MLDTLHIARYGPGKRRLLLVSGLKKLHTVTDSHGASDHLQERLAAANRACKALLQDTPN